MKVERVSAGAELADPSSAGWSGVSGEAVSLGPVPLDAQPTQYIRVAWADKAYGQTAEASVAAARDDDRLYVRVEWPDDAEANKEFQDAAGVLFSVDGGGAPSTLGAAEAPVALWYWEDGRSDPLSLTARGPGVFQKDGENGLAASAALDGGRWAVVISGPVAAAQDGKLGLAIWNGSNDERAGLAAVSQDWVSLELD